MVAMVEIKTKLVDDARAAQAQLKLPFDLRQKSRLRTQLVSGEEAWLLLPRGEILRGGDKLLASDGRIVEVVSQSEDVLHVQCASAAALTRAAYHLGNRHVPVQVGAGIEGEPQRLWLRLQLDHVLRQARGQQAAKHLLMTSPQPPVRRLHAPLM